MIPPVLLVLVNAVCLLLLVAVVVIVMSRIMKTLEQIRDAVVDNSTSVTQVINTSGLNEEEVGELASRTLANNFPSRDKRTKADASDVELGSGFISAADERPATDDFTDEELERAVVRARRVSRDADLRRWARDRLASGAGDVTGSDLSILGKPLADGFKVNKHALERHLNVIACLGARRPHQTAVRMLRALADDIESGAAVGTREREESSLPKDSVLGHGFVELFERDRCSRSPEADVRETRRGHTKLGVIALLGGGLDAVKQRVLGRIINCAHLATVEYDLPSHQSSPVRSRPGAATPEVPAMTVQETTDTGSPGVGESDALLGIANGAEPTSSSGSAPSTPHLRESHWSGCWAENQLRKDLRSTFGEHDANRSVCADEEVEVTLRRLGHGATATVGDSGLDQLEEFVTLLVPTSKIEGVSVVVQFGHQSSPVRSRPGAGTPDDPAMTVQETTDTGSPGVGEGGARRGVAEGVEPSAPPGSTPVS